MTPKDVGQKIATLRKMKNMTQVELAEKLHVTNRAVSKWENGLNFPDLSIMNTLAEALDVSVIELLELNEKPSDEVFELAAGLSMEQQKKLQNRIRQGLFAMIIFGVLVILHVVIAIHSQEFSITSMLPTVIYAGGIIVWAIELIIHFRKLCQNK